MTSREIDRRKFLEKFLKMSVGAGAGAIFAAVPIIRVLSNVEENNKTGEIITDLNTAPLPPLKPTAVNEITTTKEVVAPVFSDQVKGWEGKILEWSKT